MALRFNEMEDLECLNGKIGKYTKNKMSFPFDESSASRLGWPARNRKEMENGYQKPGLG